MDGIAAALAEATSRPAEELREMGRRGRLWMQRDYSWESVAASMVQMYEAVVEG
jgi:glycosyltransferase involved in cell wall biosynthesis